MPVSESKGALQLLLWWIACWWRRACLCGSRSAAFSCHATSLSNPNAHPRQAQLGHRTPSWRREEAAPSAATPGCAHHTRPWRSPRRPPCWAAEGSSPRPRQPRPRRMGQRQRSPVCLQHQRRHRICLLTSVVAAHSAAAAIRTSRSRRLAVLGRA